MTKPLDRDPMSAHQKSKCFLFPYNYLLAYLLIAVLTGCKGPQYSGNPISLETSGVPSELTLIIDPEFEETVIKHIKQWLKENDYSYISVTEGYDLQEERLYLEFDGQYTRDFVLFLSHAEITAYYAGNRVGLARLWMPNDATFTKYDDIKPKIYKLMEILFGRLTPEEATQQP